MWESAYKKLIIFVFVVNNNFKLWYCVFFFYLLRIFLIINFWFICESCFEIVSIMSLEVKSKIVSIQIQKKEKKRESKKYSLNFWLVNH